MAIDKSRDYSRLCESEHPTADSIKERRKRLADLLGRLLARRWLEQHRQTEKGEPTNSSQDDAGTERA